MANDKSQMYWEKKRFLLLSFPGRAIAARASPCPSSENDHGLLGNDYHGSSGG